MKKYALIINEETKLCEVGLGTNTKFYQSIGMTEMEVEQAYNCQWYVKGFAPVKPKPDYEEVRQIRANLYTKEVDPLTSQIQRLRDEEQTEAVVAEIESLKEKRKKTVAIIQASNPYPEELGDE